MILLAGMDLDTTQTLLGLDDARARLSAAGSPLAAEEVAVGAAVGRVLAGPHHALVDLPGWDNSALDGFALRAADGDRELPIAFAVSAGDDPVPLPPDTAASIATGGVLPDGADAVVAVEDATSDGVRVRASSPVSVGAGVRRRAADIARGAVVVEGGTLLTAIAVSSLAAAGLGAVRCTRRPRAIVLTTGDELVAPGSPLRRGQVHDSNSLLLGGTLASFGCDVEDGGRVPDTLAETERLFAAALEADLVVSSGGVSVGPRDHVKPALTALGVEELFWRVAIQPGKPVWAGRAPSGAIVLGLPGNPLSALVGLHLLIRPLVDVLLGRQTPSPVTLPLATAVRKLGRRTRALPARLEGGLIHPLADASHQIARAADAGGLVLIPAGKGELTAGTAAEYVALA
jgi:molybdopterin molybdotransferase